VKLDLVYPENRGPRVPRPPRRPSRRTRRERSPGELKVTFARKLRRWRHLPRSGHSRRADSAASHGSSWNARPRLKSLIIAVAAHATTWSQPWTRPRARRRQAHDRRAECHAAISLCSVRNLALTGGSRIRLYNARIERSRPNRWLDWYRFARTTLDFVRTEAVVYANLRYVEESNRRSRRNQAA
jgi:hypothetical protein